MSTSGNISDWKKRAEIDYIPPFISLWFSLNAWMKGRFIESTDRKRLELLKHNSHPLSDKFSELIREPDANGNRFRGSFGELHRALVNAAIPYGSRWAGETIRFDSCPITWNNGSLKLESVLKTKYGRGKIKIDDNLWVEDEIGRLFAAYMEIVYQIRCALFHGDLAPNSENERVVRQLYLTLSMIMEQV